MAKTPQPSEEFVSTEDITSLTETVIDLQAQIDQLAATFDDLLSQVAEAVRSTIRAFGAISDDDEERAKDHLYNAWDLTRPPDEAFPVKE